MAGSFCADEDQFAGLLKMPRGICEGDQAAKGRAIDDGLFDTECIAEPFLFISRLGQVPSSGVVSAATTVAAMIEVDNLGDVGQG
jgi:hypothetical protein